MASSKLLKEAIADAKAVRETAIANARIALEEAFAPKLQSLLSEKISKEIDYDYFINETAEGSSDIGKKDNTKPSKYASQATTDLSGIKKQTAKLGDELDDYDVISESDDNTLELESLIRELENIDGLDEDDDHEMESDEDESDEDESDEDESDEMESDEDDELDLDEILREMQSDDENLYEDADEDDEDAMTYESTEDPDIEIDLDEILREMDIADDCEDCDTNKRKNESYKFQVKKLQSKLTEANNVIGTLRSTINEVNLLNAKLLYSNKIFRNYNLTNEQKVKVIDNLDRSLNVREAKLIYSTLSESFKITGTEKRLSESHRSLIGGIASKTTATTAPSKTIITETNDMTRRFQELAGIIHK